MVKADGALSTMSLTKYLTVMAISNAGLWVAWALVVFNLDPKESGTIGLMLFYASLLLALAGTLALVGFGIRAVAFRATPLFRHLGVAHRQAFLLATMAVGALMLQALRWLAWWNGLLLVVIASGIEYLFVSRQRP